MRHSTLPASERNGDNLQCAKDINPKVKAILQPGPSYACIIRAEAVYEQRRQNLIRVFRKRRNLLATSSLPESPPSPYSGPELCSGSETGSYLMLTDSCITQLKAQGPSRTCKKSKEGEENYRDPVENAQPHMQSDIYQVPTDSYYLIVQGATHWASKEFSNKYPDPFSLAEISLYQTILYENDELK